MITVNREKQTLFFFYLFQQGWQKEQILTICKRRRKKDSNPLRYQGTENTVIRKTGEADSENEDFLNAYDKSSDSQSRKYALPKYIVKKWVEREERSTKKQVGWGETIKPTLFRGFSPIRERGVTQNSGGGRKQYENHYWLEVEKKDLEKERKVKYRKKDRITRKSDKRGMIEWKT